MISLNFFPQVGGTRFAQVQLTSLKQGVDLLLFALDNLSHCEGEGLSLAIGERGNEQFPSIHFQQVGEQYFFQIYIGEQVGVADEEGWHCFVDYKTAKSADVLISTTWDEPGDDFCQARFSEGMMFSKALLVSKDALVKFLGQYSEDLKHWYKQGTWVDLGVV